MKRIFKLTACLIAILIYLFLASIMCVSAFRPAFYLKNLSRLNKNLARIFCAILGIEVDIEECAPLSEINGFLIACNHLTYIDGVVLGSIFPLIYVSKLGVKKWPLFGQMVSLGGTIFINRQKRLMTGVYIDRIADLLKKNVNVLVFPEGTSGNGLGVGPFQTVFFNSAIISKSPILPITISYKQIESKNIYEENKDMIFWYGNMPFFSHFLNLLKFKSLRVSVRIHPRLSLDKYKEEFYDRKKLSSLAYSVISSEYELKKLAS